MADHNQKPPHVCQFTIVDPASRIAICQLCGKVYRG